jgi:monothiol glutaredoxin
LPFVDGAALLRNGETLTRRNIEPRSRRLNIRGRPAARNKMAEVQTRIGDEVRNNPVVLFMKGTPVFPQCGFSAAVVQILSHLGVKFKAIDVLKDPEIRQGIKEFSNWPTIPQLYVKGEFVGGADIIREMFENEELGTYFSEHGITLENV